MGIFRMRARITANKAIKFARKKARAGCCAKDAPHHLSKSLCFKNAMTINIKKVGDNYTAIVTPPHGNNTS